MMHQAHAIWSGEALNAVAAVIQAPVRAELFVELVQGCKKRLAGRLVVCLQVHISRTLQTCYPDLINTSQA